MGIPVLVVADDGAIRETLRCLLEDEGYTVFDAPDGEPALTCLREHPAGMVVLLDLQIPGRDGLAFLHVIARHTSLPRAMPPWS
jgi:CheY-like chemotaxis protein